MVALGTMLVLAAAAMILPGGILVGTVVADPRQAPAEQQLIGLLRRVSHGVEHHSTLMLSALTLLCLGAAAGFLWLEVETDFTKNFRVSSPIVQSVRFFEDYLGGVGNWEIDFDAPVESVSPRTDSQAESADDHPSDAPDDAEPPPEGLTFEFLDRVAETAKRVRNVSIRETAGRSEVVETANEAALDDDQAEMAEGVALPEAFGDDPIDDESPGESETPDAISPTKVVALSDGIGFIPNIAARSLEQKRDVLKTLQPEFEVSLYNPQQGRMRIMLRAKEQQPAGTKLQLIEQAEQAAREEFPDAKATGLYVLLAHLIQSLLGDQLVSFCLAAAGILIMMTIAFRSFRVGLMMLVPNTFPILLVIGGMGWAGVPINIGTAMIASVSMGLTVDSSIHYLAGYRRARQAGQSHYEAIHETHRDIGRSLVLANVALVLGFTVLSLSNFIPLIYFGVLVSIAMLGGLLGDLVLLPLLMYWIPVPFEKPAPLGPPSTPGDVPSHE
ncbi:MAG: MMPL family transporter [Planctomycetaceae bacterium]|nr:MMPL family transporter [Planctomycetaceae bacterium]